MYVRRDNKCVAKPTSEPTIEHTFSTHATSAFIPAPTTAAAPTIGTTGGDSTSTATPGDGTDATLTPVAATATVTADAAIATVPSPTNDPYAPVTESGATADPAQGAAQTDATGARDDSSSSDGSGDDGGSGILVIMMTVAAALAFIIGVGALIVHVRKKRDDGRAGSGAVSGQRARGGRPTDMAKQDIVMNASYNDVINAVDANANPDYRRAHSQGRIGNGSPTPASNAQTHSSVGGATYEPMGTASRGRTPSNVTLYRLGNGTVVDAEHYERMVRNDRSVAGTVVSMGSPAGETVVDDAVYVQVQMC